MKYRYIGLFVWALSGVVASVAQTQAKVQPARSATDTVVVDKQRQKLLEVYDKLTANYIDVIDTSALVESAIRGMVKSLDPHTAYFTVKDAKESNDKMDGYVVGVGVELGTITDTVFITNVYDYYPASQVGIAVGDRIVAIDNRSVTGLSQAGVAKQLRGKAGTQVKLDIRRTGVAESMHFTLTREQIPYSTIDAAFRITPEIGYIKVNRFANTTNADFNRAFEQMSNVKSLILDLRGNGGGALQQAQKLASFFLPKGRTVVTTDGRSVAQSTYTTNSNGRFVKRPVVVLIDEKTASASEIVAGALQDWDRAVIIGRPSYGKGLVQRIYSLCDKSSLRITVSQYQTPTGRMIQRPYELGNSEAYQAAHKQRSNDLSADTLTEGLPRYRTLLNGRTVVGGGGIHPDIYVEADHTTQSAYLVALKRNTIVKDVVVRYFDSNRTELTARYLTYEEFATTYEVPDELLQQIIKAATARGITASHAEREEAAPLLREQVRSILAERLFPNEGYYRMLATDPDTELHRAIELLEHWAEQGAPLLAAPTETPSPQNQPAKQTSVGEKDLVAEVE